jgi:hypothetical protein
VNGVMVWGYAYSVGRGAEDCGQRIIDKTRLPARQRSPEAANVELEQNKAS